MNFTNKYLFNNHLMRFKTLLTTSIIDIAEFQIVARSKFLSEDEFLKKQGAKSIKEELDHALMHQELLLNCHDFFKFNLVRKIYKNKIIKLSNQSFREIVSWFEFFNSYFWLDFYSNINQELDNLDTLSIFKKNLIWHYAEEAAHASDFWTNYSIKKNRIDYFFDSLNYVKTVFLLSCLIMVQIFKENFKNSIYYIIGFFLYQIYILILFLRINIASNKYHNKILKISKYLAKKIINKKSLKRVPFN